MAVDIKGLDEIKILVDHFYLKIRQDKLLAPIFEQRISGSWTRHLETMYSFWNSVLFASADYKGSPSLKHYDLPVTEQHFSRWLTLFTSTTDEFFAGPKADEVKVRASLMSDMFQKKIKAYQDSKDHPLL